MSLYENVFIARQDISLSQVDSLVENFEKIISDMGGTIPKRELWGLRTMAYKIKKNRKGHYVLMNIKAPSEAIHEMERQMRLHEDVLRYLTTRVDKLEEGPTPIMRAKDRGDDRERQDRKNDNLSQSDKPIDNPSILPNPLEKKTELFEGEAKTINDTLEEDAPIEQVPAGDITKEIEGKTE